MADPRLNREVFMHIATGQGPSEVSFEEVRIQDYLRSYATIGRPPVPCPEQPADDQLRLSMSLPPLFKPFAIPQSTSFLVPGPIQPTPSTSAVPQEPLAVHWFRPMTENGVIYHNITAQPEFSRLSTEELRCNAYRAGLKYPPQPIPPIPAPAPLPQPLTRSDTMAMSLIELPREQPKVYAHDDSGAKMLSITASPQFNQHSFEELRIAYMLHGREMSSAEIMPHPNPIPNPGPFVGSLGSSPPHSQNPGMLVSGPSMARLY
ncbi:hypothetical protein NEOLEDRAFT_1137958 [Neolentinus lepideus HHB14362 ss-1]|uniref:Uncharacterized protein n=1 Tax=Neolentinus lepideus HHB14362 ss-1 TaxID=1314782 RepID=A0A165QJ17_9AGAM|nr:hypothetical protein NEOLEDRAFT_1137958 [Neolentinus lepideus HHB14362 ss-1]